MGAWKKNRKCDMQTIWPVTFLVLFLVTIGHPEEQKNDNVEMGEDKLVDCKKLIKGQYLCTNLDIDEETQQPKGCNRDTERADQICEAAPPIICRETKTSNFTKEIPCKWTNGYHYDTALTLSIFLGMFGADRFYLGYPAWGLLKFSTLGFFFLGHLLDIVLIASQVVGPADGSHYIISYFRAGLDIMTSDEDTLKKPQPDW